MIWCITKSSTVLTKQLVPLMLLALIRNVFNATSSASVKLKKSDNSR